MDHYLACKLIAGSQVLHRRDQADAWLAGSTLRCCPGKYLGTDNSAALGLRAKARATLSAGELDMLGLGNRNAVSYDIRCLISVYRSLAFLVGGFLFFSGKRSAARQQSTAG